MVTSNLSNLYVNGVPTMGSGGLLPYAGNYWFVDPNAPGASDGNAGTADAPLKTLSAAHTKATASQNDVVFFRGTLSQTATLVWSKNQVHLIGLCAPLKWNKKSRIDNGSVAGTPFTPLVSVTATGCYFNNFQTFYGFSTTTTNNAICWIDAGGDNVYENCEFQGFGDSTATNGTSVQTAARAFKANHALTNAFKWCIFGTDQKVRNATNYTFEFAGGITHAHFENCEFTSSLGASGGSSSHLFSSAAGSVAGQCRFLKCGFYNQGTTMTQAANWSATGNIVHMDQCYMIGITKIETSPTNFFYVTNPTVVATANSAINNT